MRCLILALFALLVGVAHAKDVQQPAASVQYQIPDAWKTKEAEGVIEVTTPDDTLHLVFSGVPKAKLEASVAAMVTEMSKSMPGLTFSEKTGEQTINGIPMVMMEGKATVEGQVLEVALFTGVPPTGGNALILMGIVAKGGEAHETAMMGVLKSIKPFGK